MFRTAISIVSVLAAGLSAASDLVEGTVVDSSGLPASGAMVELLCKTPAESARADLYGKFAFRTESVRNGCQLRVTHPGFSPFYSDVEPGQGRIQIRLSIAPLVENVVVSDAAPDQHQLSPRSSFLSDSELKAVSDSTTDLIRYAKLVAGASGGTDAVYVDGLPSGTLPPAQMIAGISVNANPFSAEFSDGDQNHIDILTKSPDRQLRVTFGGNTLGVGGRNALAPGVGAKSSSESWTVFGPVPFLPVAFSAHAMVGSSATPIVVEATRPPGSGAPSGSVMGGSHNGGGGLDLYFYPSESAHAHLSYSESRFGSSNVGAGGLVFPEAGSASHLLSRNLLLTVNKSSSELLFRGGLVYSGTAASSRANSREPGVMVEGAFTAGGSPTTANTSGHAAWTWKAVFESQKTSAWTAGVTIDRVSDAVDQRPNASGSLRFDNLGDYAAALAGENSGTWFVERGNGSVHYANLAAAPFFQRQLLKSKHAVIEAGLRADYQSGYGTILSPRLSAAMEWHGMVFRSGGGIFAQNLPDGVLAAIIEHDGTGIQRFQAEGVSFANFASAPLLPQNAIRSQLASGITRPRQFVQKSSVARTFGRLDTSVEYGWTRSEHLLGSRRFLSESGRLDLLESDRGSVAHRLHSQLSYKIKAQRLVGYYEWAHSRDDTDGAYSFPADQNNLFAERARSAGVPRHTFAFTAVLRLPSKISASLTDSWQGSAPYNITTGLDPSNLGIYTDRGGRARNSGNGPSHNSLSLYASRRIALPSFPTRPRRRIFVRVGLQGSNLLGNRNYTGLGSVIGSPLFGLPLSSLPGRSLRVWANLD